MTDRIRARSNPLPAAALVAVLFTACLFDRPEEKVELTLSKVPASAGEVKVTAVDSADTSKVLAVLFAGRWHQKPLTFSLGKAAGKGALLKVEAFQDGYRVYHSLVPASGGEAVHLPVGRGLPQAYVAGIQRSGDTIRVTTAFRNAPDTLHWHLNLGVSGTTIKSYFPVFQPTYEDRAGLIQPGSLITVALHIANTHAFFPVQEVDSLLGDELLAPANSEVRIVGAYTERDSVNLKLAFTNFALPQVDEPRPGRGFPMVLEQGTFRVLPGFKRVGGDPTHLAAPKSALKGVKDLVVALHYADGMRIRPLAADTVDAATALKSVEAVTTMKIESHSYSGDILTLRLSVKNFAGFHVHIYRDRVLWPGSTDYVTCHSDECQVGPSIWKGAQKVYVTVQQDESHHLLSPVIVDSLIPPALSTF